MPQNITIGYRALCDAAEREIETLPAAPRVRPSSAWASWMKKSPPPIRIMNAPNRMNT